jgi:RNA polymerase sigma-70 factor (ECF subfamily)
MEAVSISRSAMTAEALETTRSAEAELVRAAVAGDAPAARELVRLFHRPIFRFVNRMTGQVQDAEDITQETFVKAFRSLDRVDTSRPLINWLFTIARRTALNHFRAKKQWVELPPESPCQSASPRQEVEAREQVEGLWSKARRVLSAPEFEVLWLRFGENLSTEEAAQAVGRTTTSIKTLIYRARQRLLVGKESIL